MQLLSYHLSIRSYVQVKIAYFLVHPPDIGGISATTSPDLSFSTPVTYSSFNAKVILSSSSTSGASFGYISAKVFLHNDRLIRGFK